MKRVALFFIIAIFAAACVKDEIPIEPIERGQVQESQVNMGQGYIQQVYFSLENNEIAGTALYPDWDIAFENGDAGWRILLNDAKLMSAWKSSFEEIETATDSAEFGQNKAVEVAAQMMENPAMGDWRNFEGVYLLDLGYNEQGALMGHYWLQIGSAQPNEYSFHYKKYGEDAVHSGAISKSGSSVFTLYSFAEHREIQTPSAEAWNIKFSKFTHQFLDPPVDYLVTGVLLNPINTVAAEISDRPFQEISAADTADIGWSNRPDIIGYNWKFYNFDSGTYEVDQSRSWIIRTASGFYYKFRFTDFYDETGQVGVPNFEFALI